MKKTVPESNMNGVGRPAVMRVGGHPALDFLNTIAAPKGEPIEWLQNGRDFLDWLVGANILNGEEADEILRGSSREELDQIAHEARNLREWYRGLLHDVIENGASPFKEDIVAKLNQAMKHDVRIKSVAQESGKTQFFIMERHVWPDAQSLLGAVAETMAQLLCDSNLTLVRRCANPACTILFYDHTKGHRRRWCTTTICGNRAKVAAHRARKKHLGDAV